MTHGFTVKKVGGGYVYHLPQTWSNQRKAFEHVEYYNKYYGSPASTADIAYELGAKGNPKFDKPLVTAIAKGNPTAKRSLAALQRKGFVSKAGIGKVKGWVITKKGHNHFEKEEHKEKQHEIHRSTTHRRRYLEPIARLRGRMIPRQVPAMEGINY